MNCFAAPAGCNGQTGLYCGEQDLFAFCKHGIPRNMARDATQLAAKLGGFSIFTLSAP